MKKYITFFLSLAFSFGIFVSVQAAGVCYDANGKVTSLSQAECQQRTAIGFKWVDNTITTPTPNTQQSGITCTPPQVVASDGKSCTYQLLAPLPTDNGELTNFDPTGDNKLGLYLNIIIRLFIGICAVLAVIMIVLGGLEYMTTELVSHKEEGKERITHAILGLLLALGAWTILNQINPQLLKSDFSSLADVQVAIDVGGESSTPFQPISSATLKSLGIKCDGGGVTQLIAIGQSFIGHSTYSQSARNTTNSTTAFVDCSSFIGQVYSCAGLPSPGSTTTDIFGSGNFPITSISADGTMANGKTLQVGDLLGWKPSDDKKGNGHVVMYIGGGRVIDAQPSGTAIRSLNSPQFQGRIKYIKPISTGVSAGW